MSEEQLFTVSGLNAYVSGILQADPFLSNVRVQGEITGFKRHSSGHLYFSLKDDAALVRCVMFRQQAMHLSFFPADGMQVTLTGYASLFQRDGSFQLYAKALEKRGQGELHLKFMELKAKLERAGYFDPAHKKPIPFLPKSVGIVTSETGAALQDILNIIGRRYPRMNVCLCPVRVQGTGAAEEIAAGIQKMNAVAAADVLIVGRGGGSIEDLWAFNEPCVASAIYDSHIPIISAVGHETDFTIADFVADLRAPTPSAAAELAVPEYAKLIERIETLNGRVSRALMNDLSNKRSRIALLCLSRGFQLPQRRLDEERQRLAGLSDMIYARPIDRLNAARQRLMLLGGKLSSLGPYGVLSRGYAYITDATGRQITSIHSTGIGDMVTAHLKDGGLVAAVTAKED